MTRTILRAALVAVLLLPAVWHARAATCDRACLDDAIDRYLAALVAHDPHKAPLAESARYTENGQALAWGDGLWGTASALGTYRHLFEDVDAGEAGFFGTLRENGDPVLLALRLKLAGGRITEAETIVARGSPFTGEGIKNLESQGTPEAVWLAPVPADRRAGRADLDKVANMYFSGLENNDGKGVYPFADDCNRLENGTRTTNNPDLKIGPPQPGINIMALGCKAQFETGFYRVVTRIRDRRFVLTDPERGVVLAFAFFDHAGTVRSITLTNGETRPTDLKAPLTWEIAEAFKIENRKIRRVEAVLTQSPYGMKPNWPE